MFHTSAYTSSIANTGDLLQLAQIPDSILPESGGGLLSTGLSYLLAIAFVGANIIRGQFQAPSLRDYGNLDVEPPNVGTVFDSPPRVDDFSRRMLPLAVPEEWDAFAAQGNAMASEDEYCILWTSDGNLDAMPAKKILQIAWSASITLVAGAWSLIQLTLAQPLNAGTYALVGARCISAGALAFRFVPSGSKAGQAWRPGGVGVQTADQMDHPAQRKGGWGTWLTFTNFSIPQMEILSITADTSESGVIDLIPA